MPWLMYTISQKVAAAHLLVEIVARSGKERRIEITPESHARMVESGEALLAEMEEVISVFCRLQASFNEARGHITER